MDHASHEGQQDQHHGGIGKYLLVFAALCMLTFLSFYIGNSSMKATAPQTAWAAMMAVSVAKALLVMLFFMHLIWEANWKYVLTIPAAMMSVFLVCMLVPDVGRRTYKYHPSRWLHATEFGEHAAQAEHAPLPVEDEESAASDQSEH